MKTILMWFSWSRTIVCNSYSRNVVWFTDHTFVWTQDKTWTGNINFQRLKNVITFGWWIDDGPEDILHLLQYYSPWNYFSSKVSSPTTIVIIIFFIVFNWYMYMLLSWQNRHNMWKRAIIIPHDWLGRV